MQEKICFSLEASLVDLNSQFVPSFNRPSTTHLEREVNGGMQIYPINAFYPAIASEDGSILLEPEGINLLTQNLALNDSVWQKGSNVIIYRDEAIAPDSSYLADRVTWTTGNGNSQLLRRTINLDAATTHTLWGFFRLKGSQFASTDVMRVADASSNIIASTSLSVLNAYPNRYRIVKLTFTTPGTRPTLPNNPHQAVDYAVTAVTTTTVTLTIPSTVAAGSLIGGQIVFSNLPNNFYQITGNTAQSGNAVTVTLQATNLVADGVTTASRSMLVDAAKQSITIDFYVENTVSMDWGGIDLKALPFRTSMIYQEDQVRVRAKDQLSYRRSPISNRRTFGFYVDLKFWRGNGNVFKVGSVSAWIDTNKFYIKAGGTTISTPDDLPADAQIFVQVAEESSSLSLFVNKILRARGALANFVADLIAELILTTEGVRCYRRFFVTDSLLLDGQPTVGNAAKEDVGQLFSTPIIITPTAISGPIPLINLPPVTVPAPTAPTARSAIQTINTGTNQVTVADGTGFVANQPVTIMRGNLIIARAIATNVSGTTITLNTVSGAVIGDYLVYGNVDTPGQVSVRFPFDPIDQQTITAIDVPTKRLSVAATLSFIKARAFIITTLYQDKAEVLITSIDTTNNYLFVDNVSLISVGDVITQPQNELFVPPDNYFAGLLTEISGVRVAEKYLNGIVLENRNPVAVVARPFIRVAE